MQEVRKIADRYSEDKTARDAQREIDKQAQNPERYLQNAKDKASDIALEKYKTELDNFTQGLGGNQEDGSFLSPLRTDLDQMPVAKSEGSLSIAKDKYAAERNSWTLEGREKGSDRLDRLKSLANNVRREKRILTSNQEKTLDAKEYLTEFYNNAEQGIVKHEGSYYDANEKATVIPNNNYNRYARAVGYDAKSFVPGLEPIVYAETLRGINDSNQAIEKVKVEEQSVLDKEIAEKAKVESYASQSVAMTAFEHGLNTKSTGTFLESQIRPKIFGEKVGQ
jgi:hypothetical protein